jgi:hypothetical protein
MPSEPNPAPGTVPAAPEGLPPKAAARFQRILLRRLGSAQAAVVLMALLAATLIVATFYEKATDTASVQRNFYRAWWFTVLLGLIALNICFAILHRIPFKARHIGFLIVHFALLVILAGGLVTALWAVRGVIVLADGEKTDEMLLNGSEFRASDESGSAVVAIPDKEGGEPFEPGHVLASLPSGRRFIFVNYFPHCRSVPAFNNDPGAPRNPALSVEVSGDENGQTATGGPYVLATNNSDDPHGAHLVNDYFDLLVSKADSDEEVKQTLDDIGAGPVRLTILFPNDTRIYSFPVEGNEGKEIKIPGREDITLRMLGFMPNAKFSAEGYVNDPAAPSNPALKFRLMDNKGRKQEETVLASQVFPMRAAEYDMPWDYSYVIFSGNEYRRRFVVAQGPDEKLRYKYVRSDGAEESGEVETGKSYPLGYENMALKFSDYMPHARMEMRFEPALLGRPCIVVRVESVAGGQETVVPYNGKEGVTSGGGKAEMEFRQQRFKLPFTLALVKSRAVTETGSTKEIGRESEVIGCEISGGRTLRETVRVNEPMLIAGYKVFQTTPLGLPDNTLSRFRVACDPGVNIIYAGCIALIAGIIVMFCLRVSRKGRDDCGC